MGSMDTFYLAMCEVDPEFQQGIIASDTIAEVVLDNINRLLMLEEQPEKVQRLLKMLKDNHYYVKQYKRYKYTQYRFVDLDKLPYVESGLRLK